MDALSESMQWVFLALVLGAGLLPGTRARMLAGAGLCLAGLGSAADRVGEPGGFFTTTNEILLGLGGLLVVLAAVFTRRWSRAVPSSSHSPIRLDGMLLIGLLLAAIGPHLLLLGLGALIALIPAARAASRRPFWLFLLAVTAVALFAVITLLMAAMGPLGGSVADLATGPVSPPAERALGAVLGAVAIVVSGAPPFHRAPWGSTLAPLGAVLMARIAAPSLALGLQDWQALVMLGLAVGLCWTAARGNWTALLLAGGLFALWSARPEGVLPGCVLVLAGWLRAQAVPPFAGAGPSRFAVVPAIGAAAGLFALEAALASQILVPVLAVLGLCVVLLWRVRRDAIFTPPLPGQSGAFT